MSDYYDRRTSTRDYRRRSDDYYDDSVYANTRENQRSTAMVKRRSDSPDYDEEVRRDFSPGGGGYYRETITRKSGVRPAGRARSYDNDRYYEDDRSYASSRRDSYYGARRDDRRRRRDDYSDSSSRSRSRTPPKRERRKSMPEEALEAVGLGGLAATFMGKKNRSRSRSSSSGRRSTRSRSRRGRSGSEHRKEQLQQALKAAVLAGAASAFHARHEEGGWGGQKGRRVLTAALTAGGVDGFINRDKDPEKHKFRDTVGAALAGVAADRVVNGPANRSRSRGPDGRAYSPDRGGRSQSRSRLGSLAAGGAVAAAVKKATDSFRGRSSSRGRDRDLTPDSYDSRDPPPKRSRSRSIIARGLSKVGLDSQADRVDPAGARERSVSRGGGGRRRSSSRGGSRYADDDYADDPRRGSSIYDPPNSFNGRGSSIYDNRDNRDVGTSSRALNSQTGAMISRPQSIGPGGGTLSPPPPGYQYDTAPHHNGDPETDSDSDLGYSTDEEKEHKKGRKRLLISGGLATVATIHAAASVKSTVEKREARKRALNDGSISKEEAQKHKTRDRMQDAASVGLAALGIKGAYSEWKEIKEKQEEVKEHKEKMDRHARKREARRMKYSMVGMDGAHSNSAPTLSEPFYAGDGRDDYGRQHHHANGAPYMSGGVNPGSQMPRHDSPQYFDDNPYGATAYQQGGYQNPAYGHGGYSAPPQGGTGFPPPPVAQP